MDSSIPKFVETNDTETRMNTDKTNSISLLLLLFLSVFICVICVHLWFHSYFRSDRKMIASVFGQPILFNPRVVNLRSFKVEGKKII